MSLSVLDWDTLAPVEIFQHFMGTLVVSLCSKLQWSCHYHTPNASHYTLQLLRHAIHLPNGPEGCGWPVTTRVHLLLCVCLCIHLLNITSSSFKLLCLRFSHQVISSSCVFSVQACMCECLCIIWIMYVRAWAPVNSLTVSAIRPLWTVTESSESSAFVHSWRPDDGWACGGMREWSVHSCYKQTEERRVCREVFQER